MSVPSTTTRPDVGRSSPASSRSNVDFPQPDSPDDPEPLPRTDLEAHARQRVDDPTRTRQRRPRPLVVADQVLDHDHRLTATDGTVLRIGLSCRRVRRLGVGRHRRPVLRRVVARIPARRVRADPRGPHRALLGREGAPVPEHAPVRELPRGGDRARNGPQPSPGSPGEVGRREQALGVPVARPAEHLLDRTGLDDPAAVHDEDPLARRRHHGQVVGDQQEGGVARLHPADDEVQHQRLDRHVERRRRLVADQERGVVGQSDGEDDALPLSSGQLVRVCPCRVRGVGQPHLLQQVDGPLPRGGAVGHGVVDQQRLGDLVADAHRRVERGHRLLEHHGDVATTHAGQRVVARPDDLEVRCRQPHRAAGDEVLGQQAEQ